MRDIDRAIELLQPLFNGLAEDRNETVNVYTEKYYFEGLNDYFDGTMSI